MGYIAANFDKLEYIRAEAFGEEPTKEGFENSYQGVMFALVVLLADSNGRGGGDLDSEHPIIGRWAGNRIGIIDENVKKMPFEKTSENQMPWAERLLTKGRDVSQMVFDAILEGEGKYWRLSGVKTDGLLPRSLQVKLPARGLYWTANPEQVREPLNGMDDFCALIGAKFAFTPEKLSKNVETALNDFIRLYFGHQKFRWKGVQLETKKGVFQTHPTGIKNGVKELVLRGWLTNILGNVTEETVHIVFGKDGTSAKTVYQELTGAFLEN